MPGPLVEVIARAPAQPAPTIVPMAAISSSACMTATVSLPVSGSRRSFLCSSSASTRLVEGVIGYHETTVTPPNSEPSAPASLPVMRICPAVLSSGAKRNGSRLVRFSADHRYARSTTCQFIWTAFCLPLKLSDSASCTMSGGMSNNCATTPTYVMLYTRSLKSLGMSNSPIMSFAGTS